MAIAVVLVAGMCWLGVRDENRERSSPTKPPRRVESPTRVVPDVAAAGTEEPHLDDTPVDFAPFEPRQLDHGSLEPANVVAFRRVITKRFATFVGEAELTEGQERRVRRILLDAQLNHAEWSRDRNRAVIDSVRNGELGVSRDPEAILVVSKEIEREAWMALERALTAEQLAQFEECCAVTWFMDFAPFEVPDSGAI